jgi:23S rRNA pseudouridine1911/1915/1917 synthase
MTAEPTRLLVSPRHAGVRLDLFLAESTELSRRAARRAIGDGLILRNGDSLRVQGRLLDTGDVVDVLMSAELLGDLRQPELPPTAIAHEDRWLVVAEKPPGMLSQPAEGGDPDELAFDQLLLLVLAQRDGRRPFLRMVHRLDRLTSGLVLFARCPQALPALSRAWSEAQVDRRYLAVVEGRVDFSSCEIDRPIARDRGHVWKFRVDDAGKPSKTVVRTMEAGLEELSIVECRLVTGRTHQVRVHLAAIGHPVVGDRLYGARRRDLAARPLLHAAALELPHPGTGDRLRILSKPPEDMARYL